MNSHIIAGIILFLGTIQSKHATTFVINENTHSIGENKFYVSEGNEQLAQIGKRFDVGLNELTHANPQLTINQIISPGTQLKIPSKYVLPTVTKGIVIDLNRYRLYYFPSNENIVMTYPVGIGRKGWESPVGLTKVIKKEVNPNWHPTPAIRAAANKKGTLLPDYIPGGAYNPLGRHALRLGWSNILIHGSNRDDGIGTRVSAGCIRMWPQDIEQLFSRVRVNTPVLIIGTKKIK